MFENDLFKSHHLEHLLTEERKAKLLQYETILRDYNAQFNLTAIIEHEAVWTKHFLDSLLPFVDVLKNQSGVSLLDLGSGAGFPGIVLAIFFEQLSVSVLDATTKKTRFLEFLIGELELSNVTVINARAEVYVKEHIESFDIVTSRGFSQLNIFLEMGTPFLKLHGILIALKGSNGFEELKAARNAVNILNLSLIKQQEYDLRTNFDHRINFCFQKDKATDIRYPRPYATIIKKPL
ncbi:MAG: 16S rRNA (guanine(527)-N(7))-methyltransferase RsmG [Erysipelotrichaceae bacterium]|nr:16S rRNA (guanine(527)-N(7))-methyltransferase RsmG [Erysipelotrichaceae bacterium]